MRPVQQSNNLNKQRSRGRGRGKPHSSGGSGGGGGSSLGTGQGGVVNLNRTLDSNGPDIKIRGTVAHICEKYQNLARDANSQGDHVGAENYLQHAEHYYRLLAAANQAQAVSRERENTRSENIRNNENTRTENVRNNGSRRLGQSENGAESGEQPREQGYENASSQDDAPEVTPESNYEDNVRNTG